MKATIARRSEETGNAQSLCSQGTVELRAAAAGQGLALAVVGAAARWAGSSRSGLRPARAAGWAAAAGAMAALVVITRGAQGTLARRPRSRAWIQRELAAVDALNPRTPAERNLYTLVAVQAAVLEELLFRGLVPGILAHGGSRTAPTRALLPLFGLGHVYQGAHRVAVTTAIGLALAEVARLGRSIRPAIALHAALNLQLLWLADHPLRPPAVGS